jgi:hypothetical protein
VASRSRSGCISQNQALSKKYRIAGYPDGRDAVVHRQVPRQLGLRPGGPVPFVAALQELENAP